MWPTLYIAGETIFVYVQVSGTCLVCKTVLNNDCIISLRQKAFVAVCKITITFPRYIFIKLNYINDDWNNLLIYSWISFPKVLQRIL